MELFTVNRYIEPDQEKPLVDETDILQKLLKKVEKRKRKHSESKKQLNEAKECDKQSIETSEEAPKADDGSVTNDTDEQIEGIHKGKESVEAESITDKFEVLGEDSDKHKRKRINAVLPSWLAHPRIISSNIGKSYKDTADVGLAHLKFITAPIREALKEMSITHLFPVQEAVIPWIIESHRKPAPFRPRDVCVSAPTGSGKTLAFAIPVVQLLSQRTVRKIRALVILPVAELALQVFKVFKKLCEKTDLKVCLLSNQTTLAVEKEKLIELYKGQLYSKVDIVVTTPGRLVDHLHATKGFCVKDLQFLVIDEADRIMDAVFHNWLYHLHEHVRSASDQLLSGQAAPLCYNELELAYRNQPHKLLFSATLSQDPEKLQNLRLFQPILFTSVLSSLDKLAEQATKEAETAGETRRGEFVGQYTTPAELTEKFCLTESRLKPLTLYSLIKDYKWTKFLCFTNSVESSGRLSFVLKKLCKNELIIEELSASMTAKERSNVLSSFVRGKINGVVCSDALARGIDVPNVDIVISYDPPRHITTYIHRIGRTARAGRPGTAITMLTQMEQKLFEKLLKDVGKVITEELTTSSVTEETHAKDYQEALIELRKKIGSDKRMRLLQKERAKDQALLNNKDPSSLTLMEKLQLDATAEVHKKTEESRTTRFLSSKKNPNKNKTKKSKGKAKKEA